MQSTWLADVPGGKQWDEERVTKTSLKLFLRLRFLSKIKVRGALSRRQPTFVGKCVKDTGYSTNYSAKKYDKVGFRMQGYFEMPEIRVAALMWDMQVV